MAPALSTLRSPADRYWPYPVKLMSFKHGYNYDVREVEMWEPESLAAITAEEVTRWMNKMVGVGMATWYYCSSIYNTDVMQSCDEVVVEGCSFLFQSRVSTYFCGL